MGFIREPKNVDLMVGPSVFTEATGQAIANAIARYKKTGEKPVSVKIIAQDSINTAHISRPKAAAFQPQQVLKRKDTKI